MTGVVETLSRRFRLAPRRRAPSRRTASHHGHTGHEIGRLARIGVPAGIARSHSTRPTRVGSGRCNTLVPGNCTQPSDSRYADGGGSAARTIGFGFRGAGIETRGAAGRWGGRTGLAISRRPRAGLACSGAGIAAARSEAFSAERRAATSAGDATPGALATSAIGSTGSLAAATRHTEQTAILPMPDGWAIDVSERPHTASPGRHGSGRCCRGPSTPARTAHRAPSSSTAIAVNRWFTPVAATLWSAERQRKALRHGAGCNGRAAVQASRRAS